MFVVIMPELTFAWQQILTVMDQAIRSSSTCFVSIFKLAPNLFIYLFNMFFCICPPPGLLLVLGLLKRYMMPTLDAALLISSRVGADLGRTLDRLETCIINSKAARRPAI